MTGIDRFRGNAGTAWFRGSNQSATAYPAATNLAFATRTDSASAWSTGSNHYVTTAPGWYRITFAFKWNASASGPAGEIVWNGAVAVIGPLPYQAAFSGGLVVWETYLSAGDTVAARVTGAMTTHPESPSDNNYLTISRVA